VPIHGNPGSWDTLPKRSAIIDELFITKDEDYEGTNLSFQKEKEFRDLRALRVFVMSRPL
jgi:hypothetical protein